ncbi:hypothetical protein GCM10010339_83040 [Streptomyces alanosinicus]|uniref:Uncharacterized protein n=1 Tax=Streptomyces alanosinicus TaxID=68171 RepID=A0A918YST7_9ACTN|nr:hypothetical protein GCM10010339_83040 [Streptomyces alanosinicus]
MVEVGLSGEGQVVQSGHAEDGLVNAVPVQAAVVEDLAGLHPGEGVLDAGPGPAVDGILGLLFRCESRAAA